MENRGNRIIFCKNLDLEWDVLRSVSVYRSAFEMISAESDWLEMDCFDESFCNWLKSADDWESFCYLSVNGRDYILFDSISGDVLDSGTISDLVWESFKAYESEKGE